MGGIRRRLLRGWLLLRVVRWWLKMMFEGMLSMWQRFVDGGGGMVMIVRMLMASYSSSTLGVSTVAFAVRSDNENQLRFLF